MKIFYNKAFKNYLFLMISLFLSEIIFRIVVGYPIFDWALLRIFLGVNIISLVFAFIFSFFGRILGNVFSVLLVLITDIYAIAQAGFENYVGVYMSFGASSQLGAVRDYVTDYFDSFSWTFYLILIPLLLLIVVYCFIEPKVHIMERNESIDFADKFDSVERKELNEKIALKQRKTRAFGDRASVLFLAILCGFFYYATLSMAFMQNDLQLKSNKELFNNPDMPNIAMGQFGYELYAFVDVKSVLFPTNSSVDDNQAWDSFDKAEQVESDYTRYIDDTVWEKVIAGETNNNYKILSNYYISQEITDKNDYTGIFKNKNLIVIMMESTNNILLNSEYYPNIYKLYSEGWSWNNAYSPRNSCSTGNNEMSGMVSLFTINNSCTANNYRNNVYPEAIFNLFNKAGYSTSSYHNYTEQFYYRATIHPNMGSGHYYGVEELGIPYSNVYKEWPSDVELVEKMLQITEEKDKFMVWMTSVSAHQPYTQSSELGDLYLENFSGTNYNISLKRYMSKLKVFDNAIGALMDGLKEQGKLDDTVIVLYADHYPYGLTNSTLNSYFDYNVSNNYEVDRTPFIIYNSAITPTKFDEYTSYMNIVPTVANLFDLNYDPRLYTGKDILSKNYENRVIFADGSWQDSKGFYNASTGNITYFATNNTYTNEEIKNINKIVKDRISMSNLAIKTNYFNYLYKKFDEYKISTVDDNE